MTGRDHEPLTPEERDLARRLARTGAPAEPSPALDARILAAARAAPGAAPVGGGKAPARRRPRFAWATGLGVAASLLLAVGIAWQLRPLPDADIPYSEAPAAASAAADEPLAELRAPDAFPASPPPPPPPTEQAKSLSPEPTAPAAAELRRARRQTSPAQGSVQESAQDETEAATPEPAEAPVVFDAPSPADMPAPRPAPPPPPASAAAASQPDLPALLPTDAAAADTAPQESANERKRKASAEEAGRDAAKQRRGEALDRIEVTGSRIGEDVSEDADEDFADQPYDDEPPASADSPEVRKAWLSRIRELLDEGKVDAARASLAEFHRRYPEAPLPDDLRPLLE